MKRFLATQLVIPKDLPRGLIRQQKVSDLISRVAYAGYIEHDPWGITRRRGHHEPIISLKTFEAMQERKNNRSIAPIRKDTREDSPLRGAFTCADYAQPITSCWSKSCTGKRYPYYWRQSKGCSLYRKNIRAEKVDAAFEELLLSTSPIKGLVTIIEAKLKDAWGQRQSQTKAANKSVEKDLAHLDAQQDIRLQNLPI